MQNVTWYKATNKPRHDREVWSMLGLIIPCSSSEKKVRVQLYRSTVTLWPLINSPNSPMCSSLGKILTFSSNPVVIVTVQSHSKPHSLSPQNVCIILHMCALVSFVHGKAVLMGLSSGWTSHLYYLWSQCKWSFHHYWLTVPCTAPCLYVEVAILGEAGSEPPAKK